MTLIQKLPKLSDTDIATVMTVMDLLVVTWYDKEQKYCNQLSTREEDIPKCFTVGWSLKGTDQFTDDELVISAHLSGVMNGEIIGTHPNSTLSLPEDYLHCNNIIRIPCEDVLDIHYLCKLEESRCMEFVLDSKTFNRIEWMSRLEEQAAKD